MKNILIFGDSYSTHKDYIPEGFAHYYCNEGREGKPAITKMTMRETWWGQLLEKTGAQLVQNNSWSGSTIGYTGYEGDCSTSSSFIYRYRCLSQEGFFASNDIDTVLVFGGTNDSWSNAPLGEEKYADFEEGDLFSVRPAISYFMRCLKDTLPKARLVFIANCDIKDEIIHCIQNAAARFGAEVVTLHDIDKDSNHPTHLGMKQICDQVLEQLNI